MAEVAIDEQTLVSLEAAKKLLEQMNSDPESRSYLTKAIKKHYPNVRTEEDIASDVAKPYIAEVQATAKSLQERLDAIDARERQRDEAAAMADMEGAFARLRSQRGYKEEGIEGVKKLMLERSIPDPEAASLLYEHLNPTPVQTRSSWEPDTWDYKNDAVDHDVQGLFANPDRWEDQMIGKVLMEERSKQQA